MLADGPGGVPQAHDQHFVAHGQQARRFQPDDGNASFGKGQQGGNQFTRLGFGLVHHAAGQVGSAAAQVAVFAICYGFGSYVHRVSGGLQHFKGCAGVVRLEIAVEGVDKQHHGFGGGQHFVARGARGG